MSSKSIRARVAIVKTAVDYSEAEEAVEQAVNLLGGFNSFVKGGQEILIKPNLVDTRDSASGSTTDKRIVASLIKMALARGAKVTVGDSSGLRFHGSTEKVLKETGMRGYCESLGADVVSFDAASPVKIRIPQSEVLREVYLAEPAAKADIIFNVPKIKTHVLTAMTGAIKNQFGCVPGGQKSMLHRLGSTPRRFAYLLVDIYSALRPALTVMDAVVGLSGLWREQDIIRPGLIIASRDGLAVDAVAARLLGINPLRVPMLEIAQDRGLGTADLEQIEIVGESLEGIVQSSRPIRKISLPSLGTGIGGFLLGKESPKLEGALCTGCQHCLKVCPVHAITFLDKKPRFDLDKCIRCFCCLELCPERAIGITRGFLGNLFLAY